MTSKYKTVDLGLKVFDMLMHDHMTGEQIAFKLWPQEYKRNSERAKTKVIVLVALTQVCIDAAYPLDKPLQDFAFAAINEFGRLIDKRKRMKLR